MTSIPGETSHTLAVVRCEVVRGFLVSRGAPELLSLAEAVRRLAPSKSRKALSNVIKAKTGNFIGVSVSGNFLLINPTGDGDVRWLLNKRPEFESSLREIYRVDGVEIRRAVSDGPSDLDRSTERLS